ncbi:hypothetical protein ACQKDB_15825 [Planococcus kocurii]|uniref:hypothetical protein n=1 Tax=Planococcus kocurii TaxID=1374 RepID=UPI003D0400C5
MRNKLAVILSIVSILLIAALFVVYNKSATYQEQVVKLESEVSSLESDNEMLAIENEASEENTFDEDIQWFVESVYEIGDSRALYDEINEAITDPVAQNLFGDTIPPEKSSFSGEASVDRQVSEMEIYGDYVMNDEYKALVKSKVSYLYKEEEELSEVITEITLLKDSKDVWRISKFEEKSNQ